MIINPNISNSDDIIEIANVRARISELEALQESRTAEDSEEGELSTLKELLDDMGNPEEGLLIRRSYFEEYAQELAQDIGAVTGGENWPLNCIDWERAARDLSYDYTSVDFDGVEYLAEAY